MGNTSGNAYALTTLCPMCAESGEDASPTTKIRDLLNDTATDEDSPMAKVPNTYLCRFFVLDNVVYEGKPAELDQLQSKYLVFTSNFCGELGPYLTGMWQYAEPFVRQVWRYCLDFKTVKDAPSFVRYIERCQVKTTFFFDGSNDDPLDEQLKALYIKQEFSKFAYESQGLSPAALQTAFKKFIARVQPHNLVGPTWRPGASSPGVAVVENNGRAH